MLLPLFLYADYGDGLYGGGVYNGSLPSQPSVETAAATSIEKTSATLNGNIASVGDTNPTIRGFIYAENLTLTDNVATTSESGTYSTGSYSTNLTSLTCATTYYFQAFATNANGNGYGPVLSFTTSNCSSSNGRGGGSSSTRVNDDNEIESTTLSIDDETLSTNTNNIQVTRLNIFKPLCVPNTFDKNLKISRDLYTGSFGNEVSALQQFLKDKGYFNYPEITGYFGEVTKNAVAEFQKDNGIEPLGGVGPRTRELIGKINLSVTEQKIATLIDLINQLGMTLTKIDQSSNIDTKVAQITVTNLVEYFSKLGYVCDSTEANTPVIDENIEFDNNHVSTNSKTIFTKDLFIGVRENEVSALQQFLKDKGYFNYPEITGYFGEVTKNAVAEFQKDNGIEPLGGVGPKTRMLLNGIH